MEWLDIVAKEAMDDDEWDDEMDYDSSVDQSDDEVSEGDREECKKYKDAASLLITLSGTKFESNFDAQQEEI